MVVSSFQITNQEQVTQEEELIPQEEEDSDDFAVRGTRSIGANKCRQCTANSLMEGFH